MIKLTNIRLKKKSKKDQKCNAKIAKKKKNPKLHMALFCDNNFKQFWRPLHSRACSKGLGYQCSTSVKCSVTMCGPGPQLLRFPNEPKVTDSNHYLRLQPQKERASLSTTDRKGIRVLILRYRRKQLDIPSQHFPKTQHWPGHYTAQKSMSHEVQTLPSCLSAFQSEPYLLHSCTKTQPPTNFNCILCSFL